MPPSIYAEIAAQINQYTDRPDLLLEVIERHDPGFIKNMNDEARDFAKTQRMSRFNFGRFQAYSSVMIQIIAALVILYVIYGMSEDKALTAWLLVGFGIFFAVTQSGPTGFMAIVKQIAAIFKNGNGGK